MSRHHRRALLAAALPIFLGLILGGLTIARADNPAGCIVSALATPIVGYPTLPACDTSRNLKVVLQSTPTPGPQTTPGAIPKVNPADASGASFTASNPLQTNAAQGTAAASSASWPFFLYGLSGTNQADVDSSHRLLVLASQSGAPWSVAQTATPAPVPWPTPTAGAAAPANAPPVIAYETCQFGSNQNVTAGNAIAVQCDNNGRIIVNLGGQGAAVTVKPDGFVHQGPFVLTAASAQSCTAISPSPADLFDITNAAGASAQTATLSLFNDNGSCSAGNKIVSVVLTAGQTIEFSGVGKLFNTAMSYTLSAAAVANISINYAK